MKLVVGIDLGTTHTVVAYAPLGDPAPRIFEVAQLTAAREIEPRPLLSSVLYAPLPGEVSGDPDWIAGELARRRGAEVTARFVTSAKSWLAHPAVERTAAILPWGAEEGPKISPLEASARILQHVRDAWDAAHPEARLAEQDVVLTLPASFDEVARELTLRAAEIAGLRPVLLEEPTAAFYDAGLGRAADGTVLVVDVGGGTTDLSLVSVANGVATRTAVGRHILLGGDNMDLALAHLVEPRLGGAKLDPIELAQLVLACRDAKERILSGVVDDARVAVLGRGSKLVGGSRSATLTADEVTRLVIDGFFPADVGLEAPRGRGAIVAFGLPYERDPAITRHVRQVLARHEAKPDRVLLNGGVFHAKPVVDALLAALTGWLGRAPEIVANADPDLAVARGAVRFGFARRGVGARVESGASHGYYIALAGPEKQAICVLPRGAQEGVAHEARGRELDLLVGRTVRFDLYASDVARDEVGAVVPLDDDRFEKRPPVVAHLPAAGRESSVRVVLGGELLSTGQLALRAGSHRLEFQLRDGAKTSAPPMAPASIAPQRAASANPKVAAALAVVDRVFGKKADATPRETKDVVRDVEKILGERPGWSLDACRAIADRLLANVGARRRTSDHERLFFLLLGFGMRPGFGDPGDASRVERAFPLFEGRLGFPDEAHNWQQFFIAWRRIAGGLDEKMQTAIRDAMDPAIAPKEARLKTPKRIPAHTDELLMMLASLERIPAPRRATLGEWIVERTWTDDDPRHWTSLGRIGARVPLYASVHHVVPQKNVEAWLEKLLRLDWKKVSTAPHAAVQMARVTGDRARDVQERLREEVAKRLAAIGAKEAWVHAVREADGLGDDERAQILGEGLPIGLRLVSGAA
jgi:hypothetical protein